MGRLTLFGPAPKVLNGEPGAVLDAPLVVAVDREGEIVWYMRNPGVGAIFAPRDVWRRADGRWVVLVPGGAVVVNLAGEVLEKIRSDDPTLYYHHDVIQRPGGGYATLAGRQRDVVVPALGGEVKVREDVFVELDEEGAVEWTWSSLEHLDETRYPGPLALTPLTDGDGEKLYDWTHGNSITYLDADDAYLSSLRHQSWVIKVDRSSGQVVWRLGPEGDFTLEGAQGQDAMWFYNQHRPIWEGNGT